MNECHKRYVDISQKIGISRYFLYMISFREIIFNYYVKNINIIIFLLSRKLGVQSQVFGRFTTGFSTYGSENSKKNSQYNLMRVVNDSI